jgi:hypothetical protein
MGPSEIKLHRRFCSFLKLTGLIHVIIIFLGESFSTYNKYNQSREFRSIRTSFIHFFEKICGLAQTSASNSAQTFLASTMLANQLITHTQFDGEIDDTLTRFQLETPIAFARTLDLTRLLVHDNAIMAFPLENWKILQDETREEQDPSFFNLPTIFIDSQSNQSCSCATSSNCTLPALIFNEDGTFEYIIPGFAYGCYLFQSVLFSSLSCLYSPTCIAELRLYLNLSAGSLEAHHERTGEPIQLDAAATRFNVNDTIESWTSNVSYERYFNSCAPTSCTYTYHYRFDEAEMFTTFLSVFSGLSLAIRFAVPYALRLCEKIRDRLRIFPIL